MKVRVVSFQLTLTPALSHEWERERFAVRLRVIVGSGLIPWNGQGFLGRELHKNGVTFSINLIGMELRPERL